jgi:hypothetical protein
VPKEFPWKQPVQNHPTAFDVTLIVLLDPKSPYFQDGSIHFWPIPDTEIQIIFQFI